jgi:hypothetical protein
MAQEAATKPRAPNSETALDLRLFERADLPCSELDHETCVHSRHWKALVRAREQYPLLGRKT